MAENSNNPKNVNSNKQGELKTHARSSSPSFDPRANKNRQMPNIDPRKQVKRKMLTEGIKKGAQTFGVPEAATEQFLNTETGKEAVDAAVNSSSVSEGARSVVKVITTKSLIKYIPLIAAPFLFIILAFLVIFGKDTFGGIGDGTDIYEDLRKEIARTISNYNGKADIDGTLILATLIGYQDSEEIEDESVTAKNIAHMKSRVDELAEYQIMTTKACSDDSSTIRQIASNDSVLGDGNYNCVSEMEGEYYTLSIEEGNYNDDNSGSVYYWNLIDEHFIFDFYNDYMIDKNNPDSPENDEKIEEIISDIYVYYESLKAASDGADYFSYYVFGSGYWWPVGSLATIEENGVSFAKGAPYATTITATFDGNDIVHRGSHGALDISGDDVKNKANIIATRDGTVVYPTSRSQVQYGDGYLGCSDGGGYGNYVIIDHGDGVYSLYAHMYKDSITVFAGDVVKQGQVIGKMGTSGNSTGPHLHFEIRHGGNASAFKVDPLLYVDPENPRPTASALIEWIRKVEGGTTGSYVDGDNYIVYDGRDGVLTVGYGIVIVDTNGNQLYTDIYDTPVTVGSRIPMNIVDRMFDRYMASSRTLLAFAKASNNVTLDSHQDDAMLSLMYNCGGSSGIAAVAAYGEDRDKDALWASMSQCKYATIDGVFTEVYGLKLRRAEEYELFLTGNYNYNPLSYTSGNPVKYYDVDSW